ncbi:winged helix-turn-helix domain-containing protein [Actinoalloteichus hymeniacidonis]|uniref:Transcriptional regulator, ArsR family n=1 Tax=Actinoalloteichus hymeniacidonis TaxID=340345 RepID=A0AAC9HSE3_9PSEU|nr:winged helix-turn-helix domain-containing protein [Actinoalloteichus hymeniacidonis]AOS64116.1 transcriptional regulator, ArsR family [Actinoalloteichus hymeniacidonis]MBB5907820.1 DNA-binding transcriptional ArsR family regulator [Actinoalloteichus hymeniacidonis]
MRDESTEVSPDESHPGPGRRRPATDREVKALGHPLRLRILRLCGQRDLTNKQLADRLDRDPGTVLYHVRQLVEAGLLEPAPVRTGESGALEKPYRFSGHTWWLDGPLTDVEPTSRYAPIQAFQEELREAGPDSVEVYARFAFHLGQRDREELDRRIQAVLDEFVETDAQRRDQPLYNGIMILHRMPD